MTRLHAWDSQQERSHICFPVRYALLTIHMDVDQVFRKAHGHDYGYTYIDISKHTQLHSHVRNQILLSEIKFMKRW